MKGLFGLVVLLGLLGGGLGQTGELGGVVLGICFLFFVFVFVFVFFCFLFFFSHFLFFFSLLDPIEVSGKEPLFFHFHFHLFSLSSLSSLLLLSFSL